MIPGIAQQRFLAGIGEEPALDQNRGAVGMLQKINVLRGLALAPVIGIDLRGKRALRLLRKLTAAVGLGVKHLRPAVLPLRKIVLMDAYQQRTGRLIDGFDTVVNIGNLLLRDRPCTLRVDRAVRGADHPRLHAQKVQQVVELQGDFKIQPAFLHAGAGACPAVLAAVAGIDHDNGRRLLSRCRFGCGCSRTGQERRAQNGQRADQSIDRRVFFQKFHTNTPDIPYAGVEKICLFYIVPRTAPGVNLLCWWAKNVRCQSDNGRETYTALSCEKINCRSCRHCAISFACGRIK